MAEQDPAPGPGEQYCSSCRAVVATAADACPACGAAVGGGGDGGLDISFGWMVGTAGALSAVSFVALLLVYVGEYGPVAAVVAALFVTAMLSLLWVKLGVVAALLVGSLRG